MICGPPLQAQGSKQRPQAVAEDAGSAAEHIAAAEALEAAGQPARAAAEWRSVLAIDPASLEALEHLSTELLRSKDYVGVVDLLRPRPPERLSPVETVNLAEALAVLARLPEAIELLRQGVRRFPTGLPIADELGAVLMFADRREEAYAVLEGTLARYPDDEPTEILYLRSLITGKSEKAATVAQRLVAKYPNDARVQYLGALLASQSGDLPRARQLADRSLTLNAADPATQKLAGDILMREEDFGGAKAHFEEAIRLGNAEPEVRYKLAQLSRRLSDSASAERNSEQYKSLRASETNKIGAAEAVDKGDKALAAGDARGAADLYEQAIALKPDEALIHYKLSKAFDRESDTLHERLELQRAVQLAPNFGEALNQLGFLAEKAGQMAEAEEEFRAAVKASPLYVVAWTNLAATLTGEGKLQGAREAVDHALRLDPGSVAAKRIDELLKGPLPRE